MSEHRPFPWVSGARAENIAGACEFYPPGSDPVFDSWANSPDHKKNVSTESILALSLRYC